MATSKQVESALKRFTTKLDRASEDMKELLKLVKELEKTLETYNADEDLEINRAIKSEIKRGQKQVTELRENMDKLESELSDTNRKYSNLAQ